MKAKIKHKNNNITNYCIVKSSIARAVMMALAAIMLMPLSGCKKFVEVPAPITTLNSANVFNADPTAIAALTGIYAQISQSGNSGFEPLSTSLFCGLSADELTLFSASSSSYYGLYYKNQLNKNSSEDFWTFLYPLIFIANSAIQGLNSSTGLTPVVKQQLLGEAEFSRAFLYFYLVNLYGDVPLVLSTDYKANQVITRSPKAQVYQQIITDLKSAQSLLSANYLDQTLLNMTAERVRPTKWAATALLARVYLYYGNLTGDASNYTNAITQSTTLINNSDMFSLASLNNAFLNASLGNNEAIWQLQPLSYSGFDTDDALTFIIPATGLNEANPVYLSTNLVNAFEPGDQRKTNWVDSVNLSGTFYYYAYKYKNITPNSTVNEYYDILRLGEQYLIRAEAEAESGMTNNAVADLYAIRHRAGLLGYSGATDKASLLSAILRERRVELFTEMGHRWLDLKRTGTVNTVMGSPGNACMAKGGVWNPDWQLYPILQSELKTDPNLVQNPGY